MSEFNFKNYVIFNIELCCIPVKTTVTGCSNKWANIFFLQLILFTCFLGTKQKLADDFNGELRVWGDIDE